MQWIQKNTILLGLIAILFFGFGGRFMALRWNWFMHADVIGDSYATATFQRDYSFRIFDGLKTADPQQYSLPPSSTGEYLELHGPLLPMIAAAISVLRGAEPSVASAFLSLRIVSLFFGMLLIVTTFFIARRCTNNEYGLVAAALVAGTYVLIDYAGNGSLYSAQSALYSLWIICALGKSSWMRTVSLAIITGCAYLITFQSIVLIPATLIVFTLSLRPWHEAVGHALLYLGIACSIMLPWWIRNDIRFGHMFYGHIVNMAYVYMKAGILSVASDPATATLSDKIQVAIGILHTWLPYNSYYVIRKLLILMPVPFLFASYALADVPFSGARLRKLAPILIILVLHMLLCGSWPVWKFRFFITLMPLVIILGVEQMHSLKLSFIARNVVWTVAGVTTIAIGILTYTAVPTHTTYYDGAITQGPFHSSEEEDYLRRYNLVPEGYVF
jgi:hypothetical protein